MVRILSTSSVLMWVLLCFDVTAIELVANYNLWGSSSSEIIYDYSGNSRHGQYSNNINLIFTDRGVSTLNSIILTGMSISSTPLEQYSEFALSFWVLLIQGGYSVKVRLHGGSTDIITLGFYENMVHFYSAVRSYLHFSTMAGWNLLTIIFNNTPTRLDLYHNLIFLDYLDSSLQVASSFSIEFDQHATLYEVRAHTELSSINDLNYLIYNNCPASYGYPCLPVYDKFKNKEGVSCPTQCTSNNLSCDTNLNCIDKSKSGCLYGLYDLDSGDCIFFCPEDSCICSSKVQCNCKEGFKKISEEFVGCVPESWVNYHKEGYIYVKDEFGEGYSLDSDGNCCICEDGYTAVSSVPFVCMLMPNCLTFIQEGDTYTCSECREGFRRDYEGLRLECSEGYEKISDDTIKCTRKIERCQEYITLEDSFRCNKCQAGYKLSSSGICDQCQEGYLKMQESSSVCLFEIERSIEYDTNTNDSKCSICEVGYMLDSAFKCSLCESEYIEVSSNPLECAYIVDRCVSYVLYEGDWVCNSCKEGYKIDNTMKCRECADGYISQSDNGLECIMNNESTHESQISSSDQENQEDEEEVITQTQRERGDMIESVNTAAKTTFIVSTSVSGVVSDDSSIIIFYLNTIQLLSYLLNLNINLPFEIKQEQEAAKKFMQNLNILSYVKYEDRSPRDYLAYILNDEKGFIPNMIYQLLILMLLFILNAIFYCLERFSKVKVKNLAGKVLKLFTYTIYIQFMMLTYLDFADSALLKILNPEESLISNIIDYNLAVLFMIFCVISPLFLGIFISKNKAKLSDEEFIGAYAFLVRDFKEKVFCVNFHVIFLVRRLILVLSVHLVYKLPLAQAILCSFVCWIVISI